MYGPDGIKVLDFGISVVAEETSLTQTGAFMGTAAISPNKYGEEVTEATDVLNLVLSWRSRYRSSSLWSGSQRCALMYRISSAEPIFRKIPVQLKEALESCLQKDPTQRPS